MFTTPVYIGVLSTTSFIIYLDHYFIYYRNYISLYTPVSQRGTQRLQISICYDPNISFASFTLNIFFMHARRFLGRFLFGLHTSAEVFLLHSPHIITFVNILTSIFSTCPHHLCIPFSI